MGNEHSALQVSELVATTPLATITATNTSVSATIGLNCFIFNRKQKITYLYVCCLYYLEQASATSFSLH